MSFVTWLCPVESPRWFHVHDAEGISTGCLIDPLDVGPPMSDHQRCDGYYLSHTPSVHWRKATVEEVSHILMLQMLSDADSGI